MKPKPSSVIINPDQFGVSFSIKQCRNFKLDSAETLNWLLKQGFRRFRLMSYWNEIESKPGKYDFRELDRQLKQISQAGGMVSLCLGVKQPRWPEYHWPQWALSLPADERAAALLDFVETVVMRYQDQPTIVSWQLENEALLKGFGQNIAIDRRRLRQEYNLVRQLDSARPICMSTSNGWGIPLRRPLPDMVSFSYYTIMHNHGKYQLGVQKPWLHRIRRRLIGILLRRPVFIHELQLEPWGPAAIWKMSPEEQAQSMDVDRIKNNVQLALLVGTVPIDLWGAEWWYWRYQQGDPSIWNSVINAIKD